jgi:hypothetical protein
MTKRIVKLPAEGDALYEVIGTREGEVRVRSLKWKTAKWVAEGYPVEVPS